MGYVTHGAQYRVRGATALALVAFQTHFRHSSQFPIPPSPPPTPSLALASPTLHRDDLYRLNSDAAFRASEEVSVTKNVTSTMQGHGLGCCVSGREPVAILAQAKVAAVGG